LNWSLRKALKLASVELKLNVDPGDTDHQPSPTQIQFIQHLASGFTLTEELTFDDQTREFHDPSFGFLLFSAKLIDQAEVNDRFLSGGRNRRKGIMVAEEVAYSVDRGFFFRVVWTLDVVDGTMCLVRRIEITNGRATVRRALVYNSVE
jgi:hypothetical protein